MKTPLILLTNDDGIESPGLAAAAYALSTLGELLIIAPNQQQTSMSRSRSQQFGADGRLCATTVQYREKTWSAFGANATPALCVTHAEKEIASRPIDLVVSGINFGENVGSCVTVSGTIGAALEAADCGIPALAVSLEINHTDYHSYDHSTDFQASIHFTRLIAKQMLENELPPDVDLIKLEIPFGADQNTRIVTARQDKLHYYQPTISKRHNVFDSKAEFGYQPQKGKFSAKDTDTYAMAKGIVSITPLSLDLTSRVGLNKLAKLMNTEVL